MLGQPRKSHEHVAALEIIKDWTRERFSLAADGVILVAELNCQVPGCPPVETVVAFWDDDSTRYRYKVFKPVTAVTAEDVPIYWLKSALIDYGENGCDCC
ncbi:MAG: hypothetical protein ACI868_001947 [Granulosicoccus sp.]|jgi:hypothetical protein|tara:strand:+ start:93 stop:392 length:300 start_codon:yes stop_codon:yes gene_type:complete